MTGNSSACLVATTRPSFAQSAGDGSRAATCQFTRAVAKAVGIVLAVLTGIYAVLSYYSSIAALHAAVEANKLTLLLYCDSNNNTETEKACDRVREDISPEQAVDSVFHDELGSPEEEHLSQTQPATASKAPLSSPLNETRDGHSDEGPWSLSWEPTSITTSLSSVDSASAMPSYDGTTALPRKSDTYTFLSITTSILTSTETLVPSPSGLGDLSWSERCSTLERRAEMAKIRAVSVCPSHQSTTDKDSLTCTTARAQYSQARRELEFWSCPPVHWDLSQCQPKSTTIQMTSSMALALPKHTRMPHNSIEAGPVDASTHAGWGMTAKAGWCGAGALLLGFAVGYLIRVAQGMKRKRRMRARVLPEWADEKLEAMNV